MRRSQLTHHNNIPAMLELCNSDQYCIQYSCSSSSQVGLSEDYYQQTHYEQQEDLNNLFDKINLSSLRQNSYGLKYSLESDKLSNSPQNINKIIPLFDVQKRRNQMNIQIKTECLKTSRAQYQVRNKVLKRWGALIKNIFKKFKVDSERFTEEERVIIKQYCFGLGNSLAGIRKLLGFEREHGSGLGEFKEIADCAQIRCFLLEKIDSLGVYDLIEKNNFCKMYKLELIETITIIRDLIVDPTTVLNLEG